MKQLDFFRNRYTVRRYSDRAVERDTIIEMIEAAAHAPNTGNMQWYSVIVTQDRDTKAALAPAHFNQPSVLEASAVLTFCIDLHRFEQWCRIDRAEPGFDNFQSFVAAIIDTSIFAQQFCTIAETLGFGTCYLGTTAYNAPDIARVLELPERVVPVITVTLGYPQTEGNPSWRLPVESIVHFDRYRKLDDAYIHEIYSGIEDDDMARRYVHDNNKETLAQVFTDVRYPRESAEYFSKVYADFLRANRFEIPK